MSLCPVCGNQVPEDMIFCTICGTAIEKRMVHTPGEQVSAVPIVSKGEKVKGFIGMGLAIHGLCCGVTGLPIVFLLDIAAVCCIWFGLAVIPSFYALAYAMAFSIVALPPSIVGMVLCSQSRKNGNPSKACTAGRKLALSNIIINIVMILSAIAMFLLSILVVALLFNSVAYSAY